MGKINTQHSIVVLGNLDRTLHVVSTVAVSCFVCFVLSIVVFVSYNKFSNVFVAAVAIYNAYRMSVETFVEFIVGRKDFL